MGLLNKLSIKKKLSCYFLLLTIFLSISSCHSNREKQELVKKADKYFAKEDYYAAYQLYLKAYQIDSTDSQVDLNIGITAYMIHEYADAVKFLSMAIAKDSSQAAFCYRGFSYDNLNDYKNAAADFDVALKFDPKNTQALLGISIIEIASMDYKNSIDHLKTLLACDQKHHLEKRSDEYAMYQCIGIVMGKTNEIDSSLIYFQSAIDIDPQRIEAYGSRAIILRDAGRFEEAIKDLKKMLELNPKRGKTYEDIAEIYLRESRNKEACSMLDSAKIMGVLYLDGVYAKYCR